MSVGELAEFIPLSQSPLSQHLSVPRREGLVKTRRSSQYVHYSLDSAEVKAVIGVLYEQFCMSCEEAAE